MGTVVTLPTAAPRKVQQRYNKHLRAFRAENPWPGAYVDPSRREAQRQYDGMTRTPELLMALAIFKALPPEARKAAQDCVHLTFFHSVDEASRLASSIVAGIK